MRINLHTNLIRRYDIDLKINLNPEMGIESAVFYDVSIYVYAN